MILYQPKRAAPPEFVEALRANKPAIIKRIQQQNDLYLESQFQCNGYVLCYADLLDDYVVFHGDDVDVSRLPSKYIRYSESELMLLFGADKPDISIALVHQAEKLGMRVRSIQPGCGI